MSEGETSKDKIPRPEEQNEEQSDGVEWAGRVWLQREGRDEQAGTVRSLTTWEHGKPLGLEP